MTCLKLEEPLQRDPSMIPEAETLLTSLWVLRHCHGDICPPPTPPPPQISSPPGFICQISWFHFQLPCAILGKKKAWFCDLHPEWPSDSPQEVLKLYAEAYPRLTKTLAVAQVTAHWPGEGPYPSDTLFTHGCYIHPHPHRTQS